MYVQRNEEKEEEEKNAKKRTNFTRFQVPKKVLLELVTGNVGISASDCDAAMDQDWLQQLLPYISIYDRELVLRIVDPSLIVDEDLLNKVWTMAIVAKSLSGS